MIIICFTKLLELIYKLYNFKKVKPNNEFYTTSIILNKSNQLMRLKTYYINFNFMWRLIYLINMQI